MEDEVVIHIKHEVLTGEQNEYFICTSIRTVSSFGHKFYSSLKIQQFFFFIREREPSYRRLLISEVLDLPNSQHPFTLTFLQR